MTGTDLIDLLLQAVARFSGDLFVGVLAAYLYGRAKKPRSVKTRRVGRRRGARRRGRWL